MGKEATFLPRKLFFRMAQDFVLLLKLVGEEPIPKVAKDLNITEGAVRGRLFRCRQLINDSQWFLNNVRSLQKENPRIRKFTTSGALKEKEEEGEF